MSLKPLVILTLALPIAILGLAAAQEPSEFRTWTDSTGAFKIEARFEKFEEGKVHLKRKDNEKIVVLPSARLSKDDQAFVRKLLADRAKAKKRDTQEPEPVAETDAAPAESLTTPKSWQGAWNNNKFRTEGPLKCTALSKDAKTWNAKFEGTGLGNPFAYDATMAVSKKDNRTLLQGTSTVDGDNYTWTGYIEGDTLHGRYRSASGNNGEFHLKELRE